MRVRWLQGTGAGDLSSHSRALLSKEVLSGQPPASSHSPEGGRDRQHWEPRMEKAPVGSWRPRGPRGDDHSLLHAPEAEGEV